MQDCGTYRGVKLMVNKMKPMKELVLEWRLQKGVDFDEMQCSIMDALRTK